MKNKNNKVPGNFNAADTFLGYRDAKFVRGKAETMIRRIDADTIAMLYHYTPVVTWKRNGDVVLRTGGHYTVTTKRRMNQGGPAQVWQYKGDWYVGQSSRDVQPFVEGMTVRALPPIC